MKKSIVAFVCLAVLTGMSMTSTLAVADPLVVRAEDNIEKVLAAQKGKVVTVHIGGGPELTGTVTSVSSEIVQLGALTGKEFYDAAIRTADISAVIVRTH